MWHRVVILALLVAPAAAEFTLVGEHELAGTTAFEPYGTTWDNVTSSCGFFVQTAGAVSTLYSIQGTAAPVSRLVVTGARPLSIVYTEVDSGAHMFGVGDGSSGVLDGIGLYVVGETCTVFLDNSWDRDNMWGGASPANPTELCSTYDATSNAWTALTTAGSEGWMYYEEGDLGDAATDTLNDAGGASYSLCKTSPDKSKLARFPTAVATASSVMNNQDPTLGNDIPGYTSDVAYDAASEMTAYVPATTFSGLADDDGVYHMMQKDGDTTCVFDYRPWGTTAPDASIKTLPTTCSAESKMYAAIATHYGTDYIFGSLNPSTSGGSSTPFAVSTTELKAGTLTLDNSVSAAPANPPAAIEAQPTFSVDGGELYVHYFAGTHVQTYTFSPGGTPDPPDPPEPPATISTEDSFGAISNGLGVALMAMTAVVSVLGVVGIVGL